MSTSKMNSQVSRWETHVKGIGPKIFYTFRYEREKGLDKKLQGISTPAKARLRKGRGAIGYGSQKTPKVAETKLKIEDTDEEKPVQTKVSQWRKIDKNEKKKLEYSYRSVEDVLKQGKKHTKVSSTNNDIVKCKVIDMTTPEQQTFDSYHELSKRKLQPHENDAVSDKKAETNFALPELQHDMDMDLDVYEENIIKNDIRTKHLEDEVTSLVSAKEDMDAFSIDNILSKFNELPNQVKSQKDTNANIKNKLRKWLLESSRDPTTL